MYVLSVRSNQSATPDERSILRDAADDPRLLAVFRAGWQVGLVPYGFNLTEVAAWLSVQLRVLDTRKRQEREVDSADIGEW